MEPASLVPKAHLLVVDDDVFLSGLFGDVLARGGYAVTYARNGIEGLEHAATLKFDLILLDVMMPKMDGFETLEKLKADPATKNIPVIMLTSMAQPEDVARGLDGGAVAYLEKQKMIPREVYVKIGEALLARPKPTAVVQPAPKKAVRRRKKGA